ncbi:bargin-like [Dreissena polymorpha]|uniref:Rho-GAP domain-containing protein n=1 Tax=Dreissena polymorpha TaxID=45954 RepID=A0A9D4S3T7_DREPO|nr:bargin-like [Dreissena polymorpha]KAH3889423.1 hypothetical protein DPMN_013477 [Dreissena polymorpha]
MHPEDIFRPSSSHATIENLRAPFDSRGEASLDECGNIMASQACSRCSSGPVRMTAQFFAIHERYPKDPKSCVIYLKPLLKKPPNEHYDFLKHVIRFLAIVACNEQVNKMSPMAMAIVCGPNLFMSGKGLIALFTEADEDAPNVYQERKRNN